MVEKKSDQETVIRLIIMCLSNCMGGLPNRLYTNVEIAEITGLDRASLVHHLDYLTRLHLISLYKYKKRNLYGLYPEHITRLKESGKKVIDELMLKE